MNRRTVLKCLVSGVGILPSFPVVVVGATKPQYDLLADISDIIVRDIRKHGETSIYKIGCNFSGFAYLHRTGQLKQSIRDDNKWVLWFQAEGCDGCLCGNSVIVMKGGADIFIIREWQRYNPLSRKMERTLTLVESRCFNVDLTQEGIALNA